MIQFSGRLSALAATIVALPISYMIMKAAASTGGAATALAAAGLPPQDPAPVIRQLARIAQQPRAVVSPPMVMAARKGLAQAPLAFEPFLIAGRASAQSGDLSRAIALMEEGKRRRPTYPALRMHLVDYYTKTQRFEPALYEIDWLLRREPRLRNALVPEFVKHMPQPPVREALATLLAQDPAWRVEFFSYAAQQKIGPEDARRLYGSIARRKRGGDLKMERQFLLNALANAGRYAEARSSALAILPAADRAANALLVDGAFRGTIIPAPFNWTFEDNEAGRAEPVKSGQQPYLNVSYFGGRDQVLAHQTLALPPGRYRIRALARSDGGQPAGSLSWSISCLPSGGTVGKLELTQARGEFAPYQAAFTIPAEGCPGQKLALIAEAGEIARPINLQISALEIRR